MTFLSVTVVIPYFLSGLGASTFEISLAIALPSIGTFITQPVFARKAMSLNRMVGTFCKLLIIQRVIFLAFIFSLPLFKSADPRITIILFLICWGVFNLFTGCYIPFHTSIFSKMVPPSQRGRILGYGGATANLIALASSYAVSVLLKNLAYPMNYTLIFLAGNILLFGNVYALSRLDEPSDEKPAEVMNYFKYAAMFKEILTRDRKFTLMVTAYSFISISVISLSFYTVYAVRNYQMGANAVGLFSAITVAAVTLGNLLFGTMGDRYGHRAVLQASAVCGMAASAAVIGVTGIQGVYISIVLSNLCYIGFGISNRVYIIENCSQDKLPVYLSINNMLTMVVTAVMTIAASFVIDKASFGALFAICGVAALFALVIFTGLKKFRPREENAVE